MMKNYTSKDLDRANDPLIIDEQFANTFTFLVIGVFTFSLSLVGTATNVINIYVFVCQGLNDSVTLSLAALSLSDLLASFWTIFLGICQLLDRAKVLRNSVDWIDVLDMVFAWPRGMLLDISIMVTTYLCIERAICVIIPHKVKNIFTTTRAKIFLLICYVLNLGLYAPIFATQGIAWLWDPITNSTRLLQWFSPKRHEVEAIQHVSTSITIPFICFVLVIVSTYIMILKLHMSSRLKEKASVGGHGRSSSGPIKEGRTGEEENRGEFKPSNRLTGKNRKVAIIVVLIAAVFIVCTIPRMSGILARRFVIELSAGGLYENFMWVHWALIYFFEGISMCVNILIYLKASTRYREIFLASVCCGRFKA